MGLACYFAVGAWLSNSNPLGTFSTKMELLIKQKEVLRICKGERKWRLGENIGQQF